MDNDKHSAANDAQAAEDRADLEYFGNMPLEHCCGVYECERPGVEYRVCPTVIVDPEEAGRWPVVYFCQAHLAEIMGEAN